MKSGPYRESRGRWRVRVRDVYVRDTVGPLIERNAFGAVKLDLALRGLAADGGMVPPDLRWEHLHDMCRDPKDFLGSDTRVKRKWVSDKLSRLEELKLIERMPSASNRPIIRVLSDLRSQESFDDPAAVGDQYVTFRGGLVEFGHLRMWDAPELVAYFAAMHAERHARADPAMVDALDLRRAPRDGGRWFRPLHWFGDGVGRPERPDTHVRYRFSERTLQRGIRALEQRGLMLRERIRYDPRTGITFEEGPRTLYHNGFDELLHSPSYRRKVLQRRSSQARANREERLGLTTAA